MSYDMVKESVPRYVRRVGDHVIQGSNNSTLVLGTDRASGGPAGLDSGYGHPGAESGGRDAGMAYLVTGRTGDGPNLRDDSAFIYLSMKTDSDDNLGLSDVEFRTNRSSGAILKADAVRIVCRKDVKIVAGGCHITLREGKIILDGQIELGSGALERVLKGDSFMSFFNSHGHPFINGAVGPAGALSPMTPSLLSEKTKVS